MTITIPTTAAELEEMLADDTKLNEIYADGKLAEFNRAYMKAATAKDPELSEQLREQIQATFAELLKENGYADAPVAFAKQGDRKPTQDEVAVGKGAVYNQHALGAGLDDIGFGGFAEYSQAIWHKAGSLRNRTELAAKMARLDEIQNSYGSEVPADGGFLIPETLRSTLLSVALESSVVRSRATVIPMDSLRVPIPAIDVTSNASNVFGGIVAYWTEEAAQLIESQAKFGRVVLEAKKLTALARTPNELVADAPAFGGVINRLYPLAMAYFEDYAFIKGSGVGEPLGFMNAPVNATVSRGGGANTIVWADCVKMYARMLPTSLGNAVWIASIDTFPQLAQMQMATSSPAVWINNGLAGQPPMSLLGRPIIFTEKAPQLGTQGDLNFVDLGYYLIGDRQAMQAMSSEHSRFGFDQTEYRIIERVDGRPWLQSAITPKNAGSALSPFVQLV